MDESNQGELKSKVGEIVVATFSFNKRYWDEHEKHSNRRDYNQVKSALKKGVDYLYTILPHELAKENYSNLPLVAPEMLLKILCFKYSPDIFIGLDGQISYEDKKRLISKINEMGFDPSISNYIKKNGVHIGPKLIYLSHLIANDLFRNKNLMDLAEDPRYFPFDVFTSDRIKNHL